MKIPILKAKFIPWNRLLLLCSTALFLGGCARFASSNTADFGDHVSIYLKDHAKIEDVFTQMEKHNVLIDLESFKEHAAGMQLDQNIHPGKYKIIQGMNDYEIINLLKSGKQEVVKVVINKLRTKAHIARLFAKKTATDSTTFMNLFNDNNFLKPYGIDSNQIQCICLPLTYDVYWNIKPDALLDKLYKAYKRFWNDTRKAKAKRLNLTESEVITIASIVDEETNKRDEMENIASVYLNRIRKEMKLQADPTARFAYGDFSIKRVLNKHIRFNSPWNTYKVKGIPPGPICTPSAVAIDAVLANKQTDYLFFCAKEDFSGYHNFASNGAEHEANAKKFRKAMDERGIRR